MVAACWPESKGADKGFTGGSAGRSDPDASGIARQKPSQALTTSGHNRSSAFPSARRVVTQTEDRGWGS